MKNFDTMLSQLRDSSGEMKPNMHILNEIVPVDEQMKYFKYSKEIQKEKEKDSLDRNYLIARLFTPEVSIEDKRYYLSMLAGIVDVAAYRAIETYHGSPLEPELTHWSALALVESKILLDTEFSGEKQFFVSTGLGGLGKKFRYFSVITTKRRINLSDFQKKNLFNELLFQFENNEIDIEALEFRDNYMKMFILCGLNHDAHACIHKAVSEANQLGEYIDEHFLLTNVKQFEDEEIKKMLVTKKNEEHEEQEEQKN